MAADSHWGNVTGVKESGDVCLKHHSQWLVWRVSLTSVWWPTSPRLLNEILRPTIRPYCMWVQWWDQKRWNSNITRNLDFVFFFLANCKNKTSCSKFDCSWVSRGCLQIVLQQDFRNSSHTLKTSNSKMCCFKKCEHLWFCMNCMNFYVTEKDQVFCCLHSRMKRLLIIQFVQATIVPLQILRADLQLQFPGPNRYSRKTRDNGSCL